MEISVSVLYGDVINDPHEDRQGAQTIFISVLTEAIKITEERRRRESHICTVSNILGEYLQRDGLGVVLLFSIDYPTVYRENRKETGQNLS